MCTWIAKLDCSKETDRFDINDAKNLRLIYFHLILADKLQQCKEGDHELR